MTFDYTMDGTSTSGAPSAGYIILNNSTQSSATAMHVDDADDDGNSLDAFFTAMSTVTSSTKGLVRLTKKSDSSAFLVFEITGVTDVSSSYWQLTISNLAYSGTAPFSDADDVLISFVMNGDKGDTGATGATGAAGADGADGADGARATELQEPQVLRVRRVHKVHRVFKDQGPRVLLVTPEPPEPQEPQERPALKVRRELPERRVLQVTLVA